MTGSAKQCRRRHSGMARQRQTSDVQLHIGESRDSGFDAEPVIGPRLARTRWHRPGMTESSLRLEIPGLRRRQRRELAAIRLEVQQRRLVEAIEATYQHRRAL